MSDEERSNWILIKHKLEENGTTDNLFYKRACAIADGRNDPLKDTFKTT